MKSFSIAIGIITIVLSILVWTDTVDLSRFATGIYTFSTGITLLSFGLKAVFDDD